MENKPLTITGLQCYNSYHERGDGRSTDQTTVLFKNPFHLEDIAVFDDVTLHRLLATDSFGLTVAQLAYSVQHAQPQLIERLSRNLGEQQRALFRAAVHRTLPDDEQAITRQKLLDALFWELTYWKTPALYEELTEGEHLHPGIFQQLAPYLRNRRVLDVGAGSGRATLECLHSGASIIYAVEPSSALLHILTQKLVEQQITHRVIACRGTFSHIPLPDQSVDVALSCSAFTAEPAHGGEVGLAELKRVTTPGGKIVVIWPRRQDLVWFAAHGFHYVTLLSPHDPEMYASFRSLQSAWNCAQYFYAGNPAVARYLAESGRPHIPFSILGFNPPCDYVWLHRNGY